MTSLDDRQVAVALSGGVDSAMAALLLLREGYRVIGVTLELPGADPGAVESAREVCRQLALPHRVLRPGEQFHRLVVEPFARCYAAGETPNPCVGCNATIKWPYLLEEADRLGARWVATGHYARVVRDTGEVRLLRGTDPRREQSYFLARLGPVALERTLLPLGDLRKDQVEDQAHQEGLAVAERTTSMEICFVEPGRHAELVERWMGEERPRPGRIVDRAGRVLGHHQGVHRFTIGQRRGLGIGAEEPLYVLEKDARLGLVVVGTVEELERDRFEVREPVWTARTGFRPEEGSPRRVEVKIRYRSPAVPGEIRAAGTGLEVRADQPLRGVAPGQAAVFYDGDRVLGGGWISRE